MNIFFLDNDPIKAAQYMCDKHVVKMILESAQILCTTINESHGLQVAPYRSTHKRHPCVLWIMASRTNFQWLYSHAIALCNEYTYRYGKRHKSQDVIEWCGEHVPSQLHGGLTMPALAMPEEYKAESPVKSYRNYYKFDKMKNIDCRWTKREMPEWLRM